MAGLQRSAVSFRRQGSSGFVWDDDKFLSEELNKLASNNNHHQTENLHAPPSPLASINTTVDRSRSNGCGAGRGYRTGRVSPAIEPPSPKLSACGFCGTFGKTRDRAAGHRTKPPAGEHRPR